MPHVAREIPKLPALKRELNPEIAQLINSILYGVDDELIEPCEAVLIFGSSLSENHLRISDAFKMVYQHIQPKKVFITGGETKSDRLFESESIMSAIGRENYKEVEFVLDTVSTNTKDNVLEAIKLGLGRCESVLFITKSPHCGRCRLTLEKHMPSAAVRQLGYDPVVLPDQPKFTKHDWHITPVLAQLAWGEVLRIEFYGKRGDISYPKELEKKIDRIRGFITG